jgi:hypothetical protein
MESHECSTIAIWANTADGQSGSISVNFIDAEGNRLSHFEMGEYATWDIEGMSLVIKRIVARQMVLWKPPRMS